ncbi:MAG: hypothetical protein KTR16_10060 [Acidiferrobacterales bacterium]|nr:hypothetical protein [Acidiferrobacterales bacterium]
MVKGDYKIIKEAPRAQQAATPWRLYNISIDPGERNDLASEMPQLVAEMATEWDDNWD